jgi:hypothetical protein
MHDFATIRSISFDNVVSARASKKAFETSSSLRCSAASAQSLGGQYAMFSFWLNKLRQWRLAERDRMTGFAPEVVIP